MRDYYERQIQESHDKVAALDAKLTAGLPEYNKAMRIMICICGFFALMTIWMYVTKQYDALIAICTIEILVLTGVLIWRGLDQEVTQSLSYAELRAMRVALDEIRELLRLTVEKQ